MKRFLKTVRKYSSTLPDKHNRRLSWNSVSSPDSIPQIRLLRGGYNIDLQKVDSSFTKLHKAVYLNNESRVKKYLDNIPVNTVDNFKRSPLHFAAVNGNLRIIKMLLLAGANVNLQDIDGRTPLIKAIECSHNELVPVLMGSDANVDLADNDDGNTAVHHCLLNANLECSIYIIRNALVMNYNKRNNKQETFLHLAAKMPSLLPVIEELIANGIDIDAKDEFGKTAAQIAKIYNNQKAFEIITRYSLMNSKQTAETNSLNEDRMLNYSLNSSVIYDNIDPLLTNNLFNDPRQRRSFDEKCLFRNISMDESFMFNSRANDYEEEEEDEDEDKNSNGFETGIRTSKLINTGLKKLIQINEIDDSVESVKSDSEQIYSNFIQSQAGNVKNGQQTLINENQLEMNKKLTKKNVETCEVLSDNMSDLDEMLNKDLNTDIAITGINGKSNTVEFDNIIFQTNVSNESNGNNINNNNNNDDDASLFLSYNDSFNQTNENKMNRLKKQINDNISPAVEIKGESMVKKHKNNENYNNDNAKESLRQSTSKSSSTTSTTITTLSPKLTLLKLDNNKTNLMSDELPLSSSPSTSVRKQKSYAQVVASPVKIDSNRPQNINHRTYESSTSSSLSSLSSPLKSNALNQHNGNKEFDEKLSPKIVVGGGGNGNGKLSRRRSSKKYNQRNFNNNNNNGNHITNQNSINRNNRYVDHQNSSGQLINNDNNQKRNLSWSNRSGEYNQNEHKSFAAKPTKSQIFQSGDKSSNNNNVQHVPSAMPAVSNNTARMNQKQFVSKAMQTEENTSQLEMTNNQSSINQRYKNFIQLLTQMIQDERIGMENETDQLLADINIADEVDNQALALYKSLSKLILEAKQNRLELEMKNKEILMLLNNVECFQTQLEQRKHYNNEFEIKLMKLYANKSSMDHNANILVNFLNDQHQLKVKHYETLLNAKLGENFFLKKQCHYFRELINLYEMNNATKTADNFSSTETATAINGNINNIINNNSSNDNDNDNTNQLSTVTLSSTAQQMTILFNKFEENLARFNDNIQQQRLKFAEDENRLRSSFLLQFKEEMRNLKCFTSQLIAWGMFRNNNNNNNNNTDFSIVDDNNNTAQNSQSEQQQLSQSLPKKRQQAKRQTNPISYIRRHSEQIKNNPTLINSPYENMEFTILSNGTNEQMKKQLQKTYPLKASKLCYKKSFSLQDLTKIDLIENNFATINQITPTIISNAANSNTDANLDISNSFSYKSKYFQRKINELRKRLKIEHK